MDERKDRKLTVIERTEELEVQKVQEKPVKSKQTNPISKKMMEFHQAKIGKFSVKDLFKK